MYVPHARNTYAYATKCMKIGKTERLRKNLTKDVFIIIQKTSRPEKRRLINYFRMDNFKIYKY